MKVILITGKAQSGKDTVAKFAREKLAKDGKRVLITHYADLLKYICSAYLGWDGVKDESGRTLLQYVGSDVIRKSRPDFWVDFVAFVLQCFHTHWDFIIIPDCRFPNELSVMRDNGFETVLIRIVRSNYDNLLTEIQQKHPSETSLDNCEPDYCIVNDGALSELREKIEKLIEESLYD